MVDQVAQKKNLWTVKVLENVVADLEDIEEMSNALKMRPLMIDSGCLSRVKRPRGEGARTLRQDHLHRHQDRTVTGFPSTQL